MTYKRTLRDHVLGLLDEDRADRAEMADLILILLDGAVTEACLKGVADPAGSAKRAISTLLKAAWRGGAGVLAAAAPQAHLGRGTLRGPAAGAACAQAVEIGG